MPSSDDGQLEGTTIPWLKAMMELRDRTHERLEAFEKLNSTLDDIEARAPVTFADVQVGGCEDMVEEIAKMMDKEN